MSGPMERIRLAGSRPFPPRVSSFTRPFWDGLAEGRLATTRCRACGRLSFPPRPFCRGCWSEDVEWTDLVHQGVLHTFTIIHVVPGAFRAEAPLTIGIVVLADGIRLMCRLLGDATPAAIGGPVEMVVALYDDGPLFAARLAPSAGRPPIASERAEQLA